MIPCHHNPDTPWHTGLKGSLLYLARVVSFLLVLTMVESTKAQAFTLIRDAETEKLLRFYADPLLTAAGLKPQNIYIHIIADNNVNAFVTSSHSMFINTGIFSKFATPNPLEGIIAHEIGHMAGGHVFRRTTSTQGPAQFAFITSLLGIGALIAGAPDAGLGLLHGGLHIAQRSVAAHSRIEESSADQAAITYLNKVKKTGEGLVEVLEMFHRYEQSSSRPLDPFARTHPISRERISNLHTRINQSPYKTQKPSPQELHNYQMVRAKIQGFLLSKNNVMQLYPQGDTRPQAYYARAVMYYRTARIDKALAQLDTLIAMYPKNPYLYELKGQIYYENGKAKKAIPYYKKSVTLAPNDALLHLALATAQLAASDDGSYVREALQHLKISHLYERNNIDVYRQKAIAHARVGDRGMAELATAERHALMGEDAKAKRHAEAAQKYLEKSSAGWWRAEDILKADNDEN